MESVPSKQTNRKPRTKANGDGTFYTRVEKRKDGKEVIRYCYELEYTDALGKRRRLRVSGLKKGETRDRFERAKADLLQGPPVAGEKQTVGQFLTYWLERYARPRLRPTTYESYSYLVQHHLIPGLGHHQLTKLTPQHVDAWLDELRRGGRKKPRRRADQDNKDAPGNRELSPRTVNYCRAVLRRALKQALTWRLIAWNAAALVDPVQEERGEQSPLTPAQAKALLDVVRGHRLEALFTVALALGLRQGEALGLRWEEDVDLERGELRVQRQLQRIEGKWQLVEPKTEAGRRVISLPSIALASLREHYKRQLEERLRAGARWQGDWGLVFTTEVGTPLSRHNLTRLWKRLLRKAGLPDARFHDLRHTCASLLRAQGADAKEIQETLGHANAGVTLRIYAHLFPEGRRSVADRMDRALGHVRPAERAEEGSS